MKKIGYLAAIIVALASPSQATLLEFDMGWKAMNGTAEAKAWGKITFDMELLGATKVGSEWFLPVDFHIDGIEELMPAVDKMSITVHGSESGDGIFSKEDFRGMVLGNSGNNPLNMSKSMVGGPDTGLNSWGPGMGGDLNFFAADGSNAPIGMEEFLLAPGGGHHFDGAMTMTWFAPVPEPGVTVPLALVFLGLVTATRRRQKKAAAPQPGI